MSDYVNFHKKEGNGIRHRGDNMSGKGTGDDERIRIDFDHIPMETTEIFVAVNIYSDAVTFDRVKNAYVRICLEEG